MERVVDGSAYLFGYVGSAAFKFVEHDLSVADGWVDVFDLSKPVGAVFDKLVERCETQRCSVHEFHHVDGSEFGLASSTIPTAKSSFDAHSMTSA